MAVVFGTPRTAVQVVMAGVFKDVTACSRLAIYRRFGGTLRFPGDVDITRSILEGNELSDGKLLFSATWQVLLIFIVSKEIAQFSFISLR